MSRKPSSPETLEVRKNIVFQATRKLLAKHNFHELKMDDIAHKAGMAKGSLYLYFKDKDSLYAGLVHSLFDKLFPQVTEIIQSELRPDQLLRKILETQVDFFQEHMDVFVHFFREGPGSSAREESLKNSFREYVQQLTGIVEQGISQGQFRPIKPVKAALIMMGLIRSAIVERIHGFTQEPLSADIEEIWDIYMKGIGK